MQPPAYDAVADIPLRTDEEILDRVTSILTGAIRRQLWLMFLDDHQRQLPILIPADVPLRPSVLHHERFGPTLRAVADEVDAGSAIIVYERRGSDELTDADRTWLRFIVTEAEKVNIDLRGPLLCYTRGVRWISLEDCAPDVSAPA